MKDVLYGLIAGGLGALLWAGVVALTDYEIGWIAWAVGAMVGYGVALGNEGRHRSATAAGALAVIIAALSIVGGKYAAVELMMPNDEELIGIISGDFTDDEYVVSYLADDVVEEFQEADRPVEWPEGQAPDSPSGEADYPGDVWAEALGRWTAMTAEERESFRRAQEQEARERVQERLPEIRAAIGEEGFFASFAAMDFLFFGLAIVTAFGLGSGRSQLGGSESGTT